jgi:hypothetical protein
MAFLILNTGNLLKVGTTVWTEEGCHTAVNMVGVKLVVLLFGKSMGTIIWLSPDFLLDDHPWGENDLWRIKKIFELPANVTVSGLVLHSFPNNIYCALSNLVTLYENELIF